MAVDKYIENTIRRLHELDPNYGSQQHQREFIARLTRAQELAPCTKNHDADDPPEHRTKTGTKRGPDGLLVDDTKSACWQHDITKDPK